MRTMDVRQLTDQRPFRPFQIVMVDGRVLMVSHPDQAVVRAAVVPTLLETTRTGIPASTFEWLSTTSVSSIRAAPVPDFNKERQ